MKEIVHTMFPKRGALKPIPSPTKGAVTVQYPHEKEDPAPRARGVIALQEENCTVCMLCARSCPDWCIYIEGHKEKAPPRRPGGKPRTVSALDRFDIDYALCMYCGICVEVCPFDALFWSPEYEYSEPRIADLLHDKERLGEWMETVPDFEPYEAGSEAKVKKVPRRRERCSLAAARTPTSRRTWPQNIGFGIIAAIMIVRRVRVVTTENVVHAALWLVLVLAGAAAQFILLAAEFVAITQVLVYIGAIVVLFLFGIMLTRRRSAATPTSPARRWLGGALVGVVLLGLLAFTLLDTFGEDRLPGRPPRDRRGRAARVEHAASCPTRSSPPT